MQKNRRFSRIASNSIIFFFRAANCCFGVRFSNQRKSKISYLHYHSGRQCFIQFRFHAIETPNWVELCGMELLCTIDFCGFTYSSSSNWIMYMNNWRHQMTEGSNYSSLVLLPFRRQQNGRCTVARSVTSSSALTTESNTPINCNAANTTFFIFLSSYRCRQIGSFPNQLSQPDSNGENKMDNYFIVDLCWKWSSP